MLPGIHRDSICFRPFIRMVGPYRFSSSRAYPLGARYLASGEGCVDLSPQIGYCDTREGWRLRLFRVLKERQRCFVLR